MNKKKLNADEVTDENGRRRFHGAFTGGFSAGYYNTVGSEEGWAPKTFRSSRSQRSERLQQSTQDFMDNDDGLLGGILATKEDFDTFGEKGKIFNEKRAEYESWGSVIPGPVPNEMIVQNSKSIGKKLLQMMGWKEGQGIGHRISKKKKYQSSQSNALSQYMSNPLDTDILHDAVDIDKLPNESKDEFGHVTFAPNDIALKEALLPKPKADMHGLGYNAHHANPELAMILESSAYSIHSDTMARLTNESNVYRTSDLLQVGNGDVEGNDDILKSHHTSSVRGLSGFAAEDDDDDDVYDKYSSSDATFKIKNKSRLEEVIINDDDDAADARNGKRNPLENLLRITNSKTDLSVSVCLSDGKPVLPGFSLGNGDFGKLNSSGVFFPPPVVPKDYVPKHSFALRENDSLHSNRLDGEVKSIFDMLDPKALLQIQSTKDKYTSSSDISQRTDNTSAVVPPSIPNRPLLMKEGLFSAGMNESLKSRFTSSKLVAADSGDKTPANDVAHVTVLKPGLMSAEELMEKRLIAMENAKVQQLKTETTVTTKQILETKKNALGSINRTTILWAPERLLCKRFNIPYPDISSDRLASSSAPANPGREELIFEKHVGSFMLNKPTAVSSFSFPSSSTGPSSGNITSASSNSHDSSTPASAVSHAIEQSIQQEVAAVTRPVAAITLLKSIFEESESEDESDDEDEESGGSDQERQPSKSNHGIRSKDIDIGSIKVQPVSASVVNAVITPPLLNSDLLQNVVDLKKGNSALGGKILYQKPLKESSSSSQSSKQHKSKTSQTDIVRQKILSQLHEDDDDGGVFNIKILPRALGGTAVSHTPSNIISRSDATSTASMGQGAANGTFNASLAVAKVTKSLSDNDHKLKRHHTDESESSSDSSSDEESIGHGKKKHKKKRSKKHHGEKKHKKSSKKHKQSK